MDYTVQAPEDGKKLRVILRGSMGVSYTALKSAKWNGRIRLNGPPAHTDMAVRVGDLVSIDWAENVPVYSLRPYPREIPVPYEDGDLLVAEKPAGLATQSSRNHPDDSLENALYTREGCPENYIFRPVNRLDKGTGGLMVVARNAHSQHLLQKQLHSPDFRRRYLAMADGCPAQPEGTIDVPIAKAPGATVKRQADPAGKPSVTRYRVLEKREGKSLLLLELETGRTHQIRVHLSWLGCPVHGDFLYGAEDPEGFPGCFALHSAALILKHPLTGETLRLASLPAWAEGTDPSVLLMDFH